MRNQFVSKYLKQAALVFFASTIAFAQAPTSQIDGVVRDSTGLAVPAAEVRVTQTATGLVRTATSGPDGSYLFTNLPIGPYTLEAAKDGFSKFVRSGNLNVALTRTFSVRERKSLQIRGEAFNLPNHTNFNVPVATLNSGAFGQIQSAADPRILQLAAKFIF